MIDGWKPGLLLPETTVGVAKRYPSISHRISANMADSGEGRMGHRDQRLIARELIERFSPDARRACHIEIIGDRHRGVRKLHGRRMNKVAHELEGLASVTQCVKGAARRMARMQRRKDAWEDLAGTNLRAPLFLSQAAAPHLRQSRGAIVNIPDLVAALDAGAVATAGLDVLPQEPVSRDSPLFAHPRVILTPHSAFYSVEAEKELRRKAAQNIVTWLRTGRPDYVVARGTRKPAA